MSSMVGAALRASSLAAILWPLQYKALGEGGACQKREKSEWNNG